MSALDWLKSGVRRCLDCGSPTALRGMCAKHRAVLEQLRGKGSEPGTCVMVSCSRKVMARGLCNPHYMRAYRGQSMEEPIGRRLALPRHSCEVHDCERICHNKTSGLCATHYLRLRAGRPLDTPVRQWTRRPPRPTRPVLVSDVPEDVELPDYDSMPLPPLMRGAGLQAQ